MADGKCQISNDFIRVPASEQKSLQTLTENGGSDVKSDGISKVGAGDSKCQL